MPRPRSSRVYHHHYYYYDILNSCLGHQSLGRDHQHKVGYFRDYPGHLLCRSKHFEDSSFCQYHLIISMLNRFLGHQPTVVRAESSFGQGL